MSEHREDLLAQYIERWQKTGVAIDPEKLCPDSPRELEKLRALIREFHQMQDLFKAVAVESSGDETPPQAPVGYALVEEIGRGRFSSVFKARDQQLNRFVALKFVRRLSPGQSEGILREARFLAALRDPCIVDVYGVDQELSVIVTAFVEGFGLLKVTPTLEIRQLAGIMLRLATALRKAHEIGILHRDIKPSNIRLDTSLNPVLLDFGLAQYLGEPDHGWGTPAYAGPEQFHPGARTDMRTDLFSLGAVSYEMLCGVPPFQEDTANTARGSRGSDAPALPRDLRADIPPALQAIVLKCLEPNPKNRYASAGLLEQDLRRFLSGEPVSAKPSFYETDLKRKVRSHLEEIRSWRREGLIFPSEERQLARSYQKLCKPSDDWLPENRALTFDQIALYLGISVLVFGSFCLFYAHHSLEITRGWLYPLIFFGGITLILAWVAVRLRGAKAVAVAYDVAGILILPLLIMTVLKEWDWFSIRQPKDLRLFESGIFTNAQLQVAGLVIFTRALWRGRQTQTVALASLAVAAALSLYLSLLLGFGLKSWWLAGDYHRLALHLIPFWLALVAHGRIQESSGRSFWAKPCYLTATGLLVVVLELLALNGKVLAFLGLESRESGEVFDPIVFDTVLTMVCNGVFIYAIARVLARSVSPLMRQQGSLLYQLSPFLILEPLAYLVSLDVYGELYHWLYLALALGVLWLSGILQRRGFYYAGLLNSLLALGWITHHYRWLEQRFWPFLLGIAGLALMAWGYDLFRRRD